MSHAKQLETASLLRRYLATPTPFPAGRARADDLKEVVHVC